MGDALTATDLWPLVLKLSPEERLRLAKLAWNSARQPASDAAAYASNPSGPDEFSSDDEQLAWDAEGWEEFSPPR